MVQVEGLETLLENHPFFEGFDADTLALLAGCGVNERFGPGDYVFHEGSDADKVYIVRHGTVSIEAKVPGLDRVSLQTLQEDDVLGWSSLVTPYRYTFDARAVSLLRVVSLDAACLRKKFEADHELGYLVLNRVVAMMAERLQAARLQMLDLYQPKGGQM
ncbi:cyclic nucleotide-binding domain-containing protein [Roseospirillum parvum]|uniref:Cyclic nucleotide-binding domain-containing protein n=1 Tax=Roseospirillum parvum TaxID=83401 RepID=A0A1G7WKN0_9PROT|nr:cyclic nucleotide-binding domain-containing protein [Roseospirillum parvum]SDG71750.1 Cyclic nucleotide-binding domain-containing protein [Roseospirillum parvum]